MIDVCQWRVRIGLFNGSRGYCRPVATGKRFVGLDPLSHLLLGAVSCLVSLLVNLLGAVDTTTAITAEVLAVDRCQRSVRCHWQLIWTSSLSQAAMRRCCALRLCIILATGSCLIGGFLLLRLLLLMSGDVESNPGPNGKTPGEQEIERERQREFVEFVERIGEGERKLGVRKFVDRKLVEIGVGERIGERKLVEIGEGEFVEIGVGERIGDRQLREIRGSKIYHQALKDDEIQVNLIKCICQGPPRVGKTHVKCLLLGMKPESNASTGCADSPVRAVTMNKARGGSSTPWEIVNEKKLLAMLAEEIKHAGKEQVHSAQSSRSPNFTDGSTSELLMQIAEAKGSQEISNHRWVYFIDSGGQPQFQEVLQAFIPSTDILLLTFKLTEPLSETPLLEYWSDEGSRYDLGPCALTNQEILLRLARMLVLGQKQASSRMQILFIGTFKDKYMAMQDKGESVETVEKKEEELKKLFEPLEDYIVCCDDKKMIFQVNGLHAEEGKFDDIVVSNLREVLDTQLSKTIISIPLRYYAFELALQEKAKSTKRLILSRKECKDIADPLQLDERETLKALEFLSKLNIILYYPDVLENVVFTSPQVILGVVTELTEKVYKRRPNQPTIAAQKHLKNGKVHMSVIRDLKSHYVNGLFEAEDLVEVLKSLYILAVLDNDQRYFMPALLPSLPREKLIELRESKRPPFLYCFENGPGPAGLFCALVVYLISKEHWNVYHDKKPLEGSFWNAMDLRKPQIPGIVTFVDSAYHFEIYCQGDANYLPEIKDAVDAAIQTVIQDRKYGIDSPKPGFFCSGCTKKFDHAVEIGRGNSCLICLKTGEGRSLINCQEREWITGEPSVNDQEREQITEKPSGGKKELVKVANPLQQSSPDDSEGKPNDEDLFVHVAKEVYKTEILGTVLGLKTVDIELIKKEKLDPVTTNLRILTTWKEKEMKKPVTWGTLIEALRKMDMNSLADSLEKKFGGKHKVD